MDRGLLNNRTEIPARCEYLGYTSEMVIVPINSDEEIGDSPVIEISTAWPYVRQELEMSCTFHTRHGFRYMLTWKCPQCDDKTVRKSLISAAVCRMIKFLKMLIFFQILKFLGIIKTKLLFLLPLM